MDKERVDQSSLLSLYSCFIGENEQRVVHSHFKPCRSTPSTNEEHVPFPTRTHLLISEY